MCAKYSGSGQKVTAGQAFLARQHQWTRLIVREIRGIVAGGIMAERYGRANRENFLVLAGIVRQENGTLPTSATHQILKYEDWFSGVNDWAP